MTLYNIYSAGNCLYTQQQYCSIVRDTAPGRADAHVYTHPHIPTPCSITSPPLVQMLGDTVHGADVADISSMESLVRNSTALSANYAEFDVPITPDMARLGSAASLPADNSGGGIGAWGDGGLCRALPAGCTSH